MPTGTIGRRGRRDGPVEMTAGLLLILISLLEIVFVVRVVQGNLPR